MLVERDIADPRLAELLRSIDETVLSRALAPPTGSQKPGLLQVGTQTPFKPFQPIKMIGPGPTASEMVIEQRSYGS